MNTLSKGRVREKNWKVIKKWQKKYKNIKLEKYSLWFERKNKR